LPGLSVQAEQDQELVEHINLAPVGGGRRARSVAAVIVFGARVATALVNTDADRREPEFLAGQSIERHADFSGSTLQVSVHDGKCLAVRDAKRTETVFNPDLPKDLRAARRPVEIWPLGASAVTIGP